MRRSSRNNYSFVDQHGLAQRQNFVKGKKKQSILRYFKFAVLLLVTFLILNFLISLPGRINKIRKPFQVLQGELVSQKKINLDFQTNLLIGTMEGEKLEELAVVSLEKSQKTATVFYLDPSSLVGTNGGLLSLAQLVSTEGNLEIDKLAATVIQNPGLLIDGYLFNIDGVSWVREENLKEMLEKVYSPSFFWGIWGTKNYLNENLRTNFELGDLIAVVNFAKSLKSDDVAFMDLTNAKTENGLLDNQMIKNRLGIEISDNEISEENLTVEVVNASSVENMELVFKQILSNLGASVLQLSAVDPQENSVVYFDNKTTLSERIENYLQADSKDLEGISSNADLKIVIGDDFAKFFDF